MLFRSWVFFFPVCSNAEGTEVVAITQAATAGSGAQISLSISSSVVDADSEGARAGTQTDSF